MTANKSTCLAGNASLGKRCVERRMTILLIKTMLQEHISLRVWLGDGM